MIGFGSDQIKTKDLGIFAYGELKFKLNKKHNPDLKTIIPISVSNSTGIRFYPFCNLGI